MTNEKINNNKSKALVVNNKELVSAKSINKI